MGKCCVADLFNSIRSLDQRGKCSSSILDSAAQVLFVWQTIVFVATHAAINVSISYIQVTDAILTASQTENPSLENYFRTFVLG